VVLSRGADPEGYARLLLDVARAAGRGAPAAAMAMAGSRELESRLLAVLDDGVARRPEPARRRWALAGLTLFVALPAAAFTTQDRAPPLHPTASEPDRQGNALARPFSERLPEPRESQVEAGARAALAGPDSALARRLVAALDQAPRHDADLVRDRAAWALARARDGHLVERLLDALADSDWRVQSHAAWALATARDPRAVPRLIPLLDHPVWRLRAMAAYALRESADPRAAAAMAAALTDRAWQVRMEAVGYVVAAGGPEAAERITPRLRDRHPAVRRVAETALTPP
jgi:HEAT repeat protein